jgi:hypothetical protein
MNVGAAAGLSGIISNNSAFLAGVFLNGHESDPSHVTPSTLSFGTTNSFTSLTPLDDQVFFHRGRTDLKPVAPLRLVASIRIKWNASPRTRTLTMSWLG